MSGEAARFALPAQGIDCLEERLRDGTTRSRAFRIEANAVVVEALGDGVVDLEAQRGGVVSARGRVVCERGGPEWIDVRPDPDVLARIAADTGGVAFASSEALDERVLPSVRIPMSARHERPILPAWALALAATLALGLHWYERRRFGLR